MTRVFRPAGKLAGWLVSQLGRFECLFLLVIGAVSAVILQVTTGSGAPAYARVLLGLVMAVIPVLIGVVFSQDGERYLLVLPVLGWAFTAFALACGVLVTTELRGGHDHQRCVSRSTMVVVPSARCQAAAGPGSAEWYYGGFGYQVGDPVRGGSVTAPSNQGGTGGGSGPVDDPGDDSNSGGGADDG